MELIQMANKRRNEKHNTGLKTMREDKLTETNTSTTKVETAKQLFPIVLTVMNLQILQHCTVGYSLQP
jgi:hypothetical protein